MTRRSLQRLAKSSAKVVQKSGGVEVDGTTKVGQKYNGKAHESTGP
jgi:hypothetical protein